MELSRYNRGAGCGWVNGFAVGGLLFVRLVALRAEGNDAFRLVSAGFDLVLGASDLCRECLVSGFFVETGRTVL
jgi:hypothetical protein